MTVGVGDYAQAQYEFQGESPGDLSLAVGDVVKITDSVDNNWLSGEKVGHELPGQSGCFPAAFVEQLSLPLVRTGQKIFLVLEDFLADQIGDLELTKGEIVVGTEAVDDSWWRGKNGPLKGIFPLSFVAELQHDDGLRSRSYSARAGSLKSRSGSLADSRTGSIGGYDGVRMAGSFDASVTKVTEPTFGRALVDVSPQLEGELKFQLGDLIEITEIIDDDWFFGRCHEKEGLVSAMCVELLEEVGGGQADNRLSTSESVDTSQHFLPHVPYLTGSEKSGEDDDDYRLRNVSSGSYTSENTRSHDAEIVPYAQVLYPFTAQARSELSLQEGQIVTLIGHLNADWTEGELDGHRGIFPTSFVEIVVDCPYVGRSSRGQGQDGELAKQDEQLITNSTAGGKAASSEITDCATALSDKVTAGVSIIDRQNLENSKTEEAEKDHGKMVEPVEGSPGLTGGTNITAGITEVLEISRDSEIGLVLHTFLAQVEGDVTVREGDTVEVLRRVDDNWLEVRTDAAHTGLVPCNHVELIGIWTKEEPVSAGMKEDRPGQAIGNAGSEISSNMQGVHDSHLRETSAKPNGGQRIFSDASPRPAKPVCVPPSKPPALPPVKPHPPPKPALGPKPALKSKPTPPVSKLSATPVSKSQGPVTSSSKPVRPPSLITAKPFSSLPRAKPHHVMSPTERRLSMSSLDAIIEGEIEKAKSRSNSQASDTASDQGSSTMGASDVSMSTAGEQSGPSSSSTLNASSTSSLLGRHRSLQNTDSLGSSQASKEPLSFEDNFTGVSPATASQGVVNSSAVVRPALTSSLSVAEDRLPGYVDSAQRRKSASFAEHARRGQSLSSAAAEEGKQSAFVNRAFEMEVDEGSLVNFDGDHGPSPSFQDQPRRVPPARPPSANTNSSTVVQSTKVKAPPPRPTGPRIAPAPSKVPLVPDKVAPLPVKLVPKRPAPRAPGAAICLNNNNHSSTKPADDVEALFTATSVSTVSGQAPSKQIVPRPAPLPPQRQPPRPASLATPPPRAPPPRPADLMSFSPENDVVAKRDQDVSEETTKEMVRDIKTKLEENKADIKVSDILLNKQPPDLRVPFTIVSLG